MSGFRASGLWPLDRNQVLKRLPSCNDTSNINEFSFNKSVLKVLKENCGIGALKRHAKKRGRKVEPGQGITTNIFSSDDENEESSASRSKQQKKVSKRNKLYIGKINNNDEEQWKCQEWEELWDDESGDRCIICDICCAKFHLQCSGLRYKQSEYWKLDLENISYECNECTESI